MIRGNIAAAMQGLAVVPLFVGYDADGGIGRIFSYNMAGGPYESTGTTRSAPDRCSPGAR